MENKLILQKMLKYIANKPIFEKYNNLYNRDFLAEISYEKAISKFSVGLLFLLTQKRGRLNNITEKDIIIASEIQMIFLSADLYDDFFDKDNEKLYYMSENNIVILATELLTTAIKELSFLNNFDIAMNYLNEALEGEFFDVNNDIYSLNINEKYYFNIILKKSICLFKFLFVLADYSNFSSIWCDFSEKYATSLQIGNDFYGIQSKSNVDLLYRKISFPFVLLLQHYEQDTIHKMTIEEIQKKIDEIGILEYNLFVYMEMQNECKEILKSKNISEDIIKYLRIGERNFVQKE